jgi:hypothetical protein
MSSFGCFGGSSTPAIAPIIEQTDSVIIDSTYLNSLCVADPLSSVDGHIIIYLPAGLPKGFSFDVMRISAGAVYFLISGSSTIYNIDTSITNEYERVKVTVGIGQDDEWVLEGNLEPIPTLIPNELTYYWSVESVTTTGSSVDSWLERKALAGDNWSQTGVNRPTIVTSGGPGGTVDAIAFNGTTQFFPRFVLSTPVTQSFFVTICMDELEGGGDEGFVYDDTPSSSFLMMRMSYGAMNCYSGGGGSFDVVSIPSLPAGWFVLTVFFDGTSTRVLLDNGAWSPPITSGGSNGINGLSFGQRSDNTLRGAMRVTDFGIGAGTQANAETVHNYIKNLRGL